MTRDELRQRLAFYQDLGITTIYRRTVEAPPIQAAAVFAAAEPPPAPVPEPVVVAPPPAPVLSTPEPALLIDLKPQIAPPGDTLLRILEDIGDCQRCVLHRGRTKLVYGSGNEQARLVFVGEGPGADEDASGLPFVGKAGQLLTQMINNTAAKEGMSIRRDDVYIANVVKCRPPGNRTPEADEMETCSPFLFRQLLAIKPKAIVALGATAAKTLVGRKESLTRMRGNWFSWEEIPVMVTYHPSYLLRVNTPQVKREAWEDLKKALHFVYDEAPE